MFGSFEVLVLMTLLPNTALGIYSDKLANNGDYPSAAGILNDSKVQAMGVLVTHKHVFSACSVVGYFIEHNDTKTIDDIIEYYDERPNGTEVPWNTSLSYTFRPHSTENLSLVAGSTWIYDLEGGQSRTVGNSYVHPDCAILSGASKVIRHNVGIFEARDDFIATRNLKALSLWSQYKEHWKPQYQYLMKNEITCEIVGWGENQHKPYSERLRIGDVKVVPEGHCINRYCESASSDELCIDLRMNFGAEGKLCVANVGASFPCVGDVGAALYCDGYAYGVLSSYFNCSQQSLSIFHGVDWSIDLYYTVQREAATAALVASIGRLTIVFSLWSAENSIL